MSPRPIGLSDAQLDAIKIAARHVEASRRCEFLRAVASALGECEPGDGDVARAIRVALASAVRWTRA